VVDLIDVSIPQIGLKESTQVSGKISDQQFFITAFTLPERGHLFLHHHCTNSAFNLLLAEMLQPIFLRKFIAFGELFTNPLAG
jgi:hypothetical protein